MSESQASYHAPLGPATRAIHGSGNVGGSGRLGSPIAPPIVQSSTFAFDTPEEMIDVFEGKRAGYVYSRYDNPTVRVVEEKLASLEEGDFGLVFSSGMAAIHGVLWSTLDKGDLLVSGRDLYGGTNDLLGKLLPRLGIRHQQVDLNDDTELDRALSEGPAAVYFETPTNPLLSIVDGHRVVERAKGAGARLIVDNTFATPMIQNPLSWGADLVIHSATKYLGGHSDLTLGVVVGKEKDHEALERARRSLGGVADPFAAWLLNRGLATLSIRIRTQSDSAGRIAERLAAHPCVERVHYPGLFKCPERELAGKQMRHFGGMLSMELPGGRDGAVAFMRRLRLVRLATSLGGVETIASHPVTSSHRMLNSTAREELGIREGLVRLSVGLEDIEDLLFDIEGALEGARAGER